MSLEVAIPLGIGSAIVYGISIVVQHDAAHLGTGEEDPKRLLRLLHNPRWLLAIAGDAVGFALQIAALSTGPVVVIQPLVVLMLPVALIAGWLMGARRPRLGDYLGSLAVLAGLAGFLAMVGRPGRPHPPNPWHASIAVVVVLGVGIVLAYAVRERSATLRGAVYGGVAGTCFGTLGVLINTVSHRVVDHGFGPLLTRPSGVVSLVGIALMGALGIVLTQLSFQVGKLGATLPANLSTDPVAAVVLGAVLLREHIPTGPLFIVGYLACLAAVVAGNIRLAAPRGSSSFSAPARTPS